MQTTLAQLKRRWCVKTMQIGIIETINPGLGVLEVGHPADAGFRYRIGGQT